MYKIAIIQFPGTNCEYEARRAINKSGLRGEFFRWNQPAKDLDNFDGYIIPGGFSYEDRSRAGIIASLDPIMNKIKQEAEKGKPVLGICNGCQILMETGLVPGLDNYALGGAMSLNTRVNHGQIIDTGYYNEWIYIKNQAENRCAFNLELAKDYYFKVPIAHGEGKFIMDKKLIKELSKHHQIIFRYCDQKGKIKNKYPINPNGTMDNIAGICNKKGNVLAMMPHPERTANGQFVFESMKKYLAKNLPQTKSEGKKSEAEDYKLKYQKIFAKPGVWKKTKNSLELLVDLIITDNETVTIKNTLKHLGFNVEIKKGVYWQVKYSRKPDIDKLIKSGELLNTNKEKVIDKLPQDYYNLLTSYKDNYEGRSKLSTLKHRLGFNEIKDIKKGILWQIKAAEKDLDKILATNIFYNPYSQDCFIYNS